MGFFPTLNIEVNTGRTDSLSIKVVWIEAYLDAMKGVMSNSRGKET